MFDIGFPELLLILFVGLVVIGPDKLPQLIKTSIRSFRTLRGYLVEAKSQIEKSVGIEEIRQDLHNEKIVESLKENQKTKKRKE